MNTYDFDKTIFEVDSSFLFFKFSFKRHPAAVMKTLPKLAALGIGHALGKTETKRVKQQAFSFLKDIDDIDRDVIDFWNENWGKIGKWYLEQKREDDVIISASPEFLLSPMAERLGVRLIATKMDKETGLISGLNCHDSEKVRRFGEEYPNDISENFYSDSLSDTPMAEISQKAFLIRRGTIKPWPGK